MKTMKRPTHGGRVTAVARRLGCRVEDLLDFSASINPLGMPEGVRRAASDALSRVVHYPEADAASLIEALAAYHCIPESHFLAGNGSTELFYLFPRVLRPRRALVVVPAFGEYERGLRLVGVPVDVLPLLPDEMFRLDPGRLLESLAPETDLVMFANPGNPSGAGIDVEAVLKIVRGVRGQALVAVDEAFADFSPERSVVARVPEFDNLYVFRSLTKFYAIPGLRAGYLVGPPPGIRRLAAAKEPWSLSVPAIAAARACLEQDDYRRRSLESVAALRCRLTAQLAELGLQVFPSEANFLLVRLPPSHPPASEVAGSLCQKGILVRGCSDFASLDNSYLRLAVRTEEENRSLLAELSRLFDRPKDSDSAGRKPDANGVG